MDSPVEQKKVNHKHSEQENMRTKQWHPYWPINLERGILHREEICLKKRDIQVETTKNLGKLEGQTKKDPAKNLELRILS